MSENENWWFKKSKRKLSDCIALVDSIRELKPKVKQK